MEKSFELGPSDSLRALFFVFFLLGRKQGFWIFIPVIFVPVGILVTGTGSARFATIVVILVLAYGMFHGIYVSNRKKGIYGRWRAYVTTDGIRFLPPNQNQAFIKWSNSNGIHLSKRFLYLMVNSYNPVMIPRGTFTPIEEQELLQLAGDAREKDHRATWKRGVRAVFIYILVLLLIVGIINYLTQGH